MDDDNQLIAKSNFYTFIVDEASTDYLPPFENDFATAPVNSTYTDCETNASCTNIALHKYVAVSSEFDPDSPASAAIDGNTGSGSLSVSAAERGAYWLVDLDGLASIKTVTIYGRTDCCLEESSQINVGYSVDGDIWYKQTIPDSTADGITIDIANTARYIGIETRANNRLSLQEVVVTGKMEDIE